MKVIEVDVVKLKNYKLNSKIHTDKQIKQIANSIKKYGFTQPLVIDKNFEVVIGHGRLFGAKRLGYSKVPCVIRDDLTPDEIKALRILDNKLSTQTGYDEDKLLEDIENIDFDFGSLEIQMEDILGDMDLEDVNIVDDYEDEDMNPDVEENKKNSIIKNCESDNIDIDNPTSNEVDNSGDDEDDQSVEDTYKEIRVFIVEAQCETFEEQLAVVNLLRSEGIKVVIK